MTRKEFLPCGLTLGPISAISHTLYVAFGLVAPQSLRMHKAWEALAAGVDAFVSKGDPPERLLSTIDGCAGTRSADQNSEN